MAASPEGGERRAQRLAAPLRSLQHHARAHQHDPAVGVARIGPQARREPVDHLAAHLVLLARRHRRSPRASARASGRGCRRWRRRAPRPAPRRGGRGGRRPADVDIVALGRSRSPRSRTCCGQAAPAGASRSRAIRSSTAPRWSPRIVPDRGEIEARLRDCRAAARARGGTAARPRAAAAGRAASRRSAASRPDRRCNRRCAAQLHRPAERLRRVAAKRSMPR